MDQQERTKFTSHLFNRINRRFFEISDCRSFLKENTESALPAVVAKKRGLLESIAKDPAFDGVFLDKESFIDRIPSQASWTGLQTVMNMDKFVTSSSFVFAHAIVDEAVTDLLEFAANFESDYWHLCLQDTKVVLKDLRSKSYDALLQVAKNRKVKELRNSDLSRKAETLLKITGDRSDKSVDSDYKFDLERIKRLDKTRHSIVHRGGPLVEVDHYDEAVWFLQRTAIFLLIQAIVAFDARIDPGLVGDGAYGQ